MVYDLQLHHVVVHVDAEFIDTMMAIKMKYITNKMKSSPISYLHFVFSPVPFFPLSQHAQTAR